MENEGWLADLIAGMAESERLAQAGIPRPPPPDVLAGLVRFDRAILGWKQQTLASLANVSLTTVERIERGETVSRESLDQVAVALGRKWGDFTEPRVPFGFEKTLDLVEKYLAPIRERVAVPVRRLCTQPQIAKLAQTHLYLIDGNRLEADCQGQIASLGEWLDLVSFILSTEENDSIVQIDRRHRAKRRQLYTQVLDCVRDIERQGQAVALAGTYIAGTNDASLPKVEVALVGFFPKRTDPGAIKRRALLAPAKVDLKAVWKGFLDETT